MVIASPRDLCRLALAGGAFLALACGHTDPFAAPPYGTTQPFDPTPPIRLTLNASADREASWLPDGSGILYSAQPFGRNDFDVCLAELPPGGGSQRRLVCDLTSLDGGTTNAIDWPVVAADGKLAFVKASNTIGGTGPSLEAIAVAPRLDATIASSVQPIPYTIPGESPQTAVAALRWLGDSRLVYVGSAVAYRRPCESCLRDTLVAGREVVVLDVSVSPAVPVPVAGTGFASGVSRGASDDEIYYTVGGDTRVFRLVLSTGEVSVAHDFGAAGIARDVHVAGGRLTATVGGRVAVTVDPQLGPIQRDSGGTVHVVDLASGGDVALDGPGLFRRPVLSPAADRVVAEGYPLIVGINPVTGVEDTMVARAGDLYLFSIP
jgi:hypothetical protein